jgi:prolyl oligopeptidase
LRSQTMPIGPGCIAEDGDVREEKAFKSLYAISPYHHVQDGIKYPAVMGVTGANDPRVPPWMVAKMIARLQAATASGRPVLLRVDFDAGHGRGSSRSQLNQQLTDERSLVLWQTGDPEFQPH